MQPIEPKRSAWLFPITYLLHLSEEYWGGEGFPAWISRVAGADFSPSDFLVLNSIGLILVTVAAALTARYTWRWLLVTLAGIVFLNGTLHLVFSILTWTYSPGLLTGTLLWMPFGARTIYQQWSLATRRSFWIGVGLALGLHAIVSLLALLA